VLSLLLILSTLLWGSAVSAHQHLDLKHDTCDICLLPHAGTAGNNTPEISHRFTPAPAEALLPRLHLPVRNTAYDSRAPPR
jgi:hypothetical protein